MSRGSRRRLTTCLPAWTPSRADAIPRRAVMTLELLATLADLAALNIDVSDTALADSLLASMSAAVREAAGTPITDTTSTVRFKSEERRVGEEGRSRRH